jgi:hypothetical protein
LKNPQTLEYLAFCVKTGRFLKAVFWILLDIKELKLVAWELLGKLTIETAVKAFTNSWNKNGSKGFLFCKITKK